MNKKIKICLDAWHYGSYNKSPANKNYTEAKAMWKLHLLLEKQLEDKGIEVIKTRTNQSKDLDLTSRGKASIGCNLFVSLHSNAVGSYIDENIDYVVAYSLAEDKNTKIDEISKEIGSNLANSVATVMGTKQKSRVTTRLSSNDRNGDGVLNDNYYGVLHGARLVGTPAIILEHSFHTNTKMTNWLLDDSNLEKLAIEEANVIAKYFGVEAKKENNVPVNKSNIVLEWQNAAIADGFEFPKYGADGIWGDECREVAKKAVVKERTSKGKWVWKYPNLTKVAQKLLGFTGDDIDGKCGSGTGNKIEYYQGQNKLEPDRCVGVNTWEDLLGV